MGKAKQCFVYNTKIIETPTTKEVYFYETPIYSHSNSDSKTSNTQAHKRKVFDEMSAHKQYDSLKRKQKHYEQDPNIHTRRGLPRQDLPQQDIGPTSPFSLTFAKLR